MKNATGKKGVWRLVRLAGCALAAAPVALMLVTGLAGSLAAGGLRMDVLLPAELAFLALPGMALITLGRAGEKTGWRLSAALTALALISLGGCLAAAWASGIASGKAPAQGPLWWLTIALLAVYDLCAAAAPVAGLWASAGKR